MCAAYIRDTDRDFNSPLAEEIDATALVADEREMRRFVNTLFKNCVGSDGKPVAGRFAFRAFRNADGTSVLHGEWEPLIGTPVARAANLATRVARRSAAEAAVFAPPVCVFNLTGGAREADVLACPVVVAEMDKDPEAGLRVLENILGAPTLKVASGGVWADAGGRSVDKLHVYWRLVAPAATEAEKALLKAVRKAAAKKAGGDATAAPLSHPLRWPGSWHTKATPRLCRIVGGDEKHEIELAHAARLLGVDLASTSARRPSGSGPAQSFQTRDAWSEKQLLDVAKMLPNANLPWDEWNTTGLAFYDASHGSGAGFEAFDAFSEKSPRKYDFDQTVNRWDHYSASPPDRISGNWLIERMREKVDPTFCLSSELPEKDRQALREMFAISEDLERDEGPLDIFNDADPGELADVPAGALPPMLHRWVRSEARRKGAPESFAAIAALTAIGSVIGADIRIQVREWDNGWVEAANLWSVIVAYPGNGKSPSIDAAMETLREIDARWVEHDQARYREWQAATKRNKGAEAGPEPKIRRAVVDDMTAEKAVRIFRDNPKGVIQAPDELAGLLGGFGAYKKGAGADRSHFLRAFDGGAIVSDRVGSGTIAAQRAVLSVIAGTQPDKVREMAKGLGADGLLQRFLPVVHDERERPEIDETPDQAAAAWYVSLIDTLAHMGSTLTGPVRMTSEAHAIVADASGRIRALKSMPGASEALAGHLRKWGRLLPRLLLVVHVARMSEREKGFDPTIAIEADTADMAVRLARFFVRHAISFYATYFGASSQASEARWIAGYLLTRRDLRRFRRRDIYDARKTLRGPDGLRALLGAMRELEAAGWCEVKEHDADGPSAWQVDQRIHDRFAERAVRERRERADRHARMIEASKAAKWIAGDQPRVLDSTEGILG